MHVLPLPSPVGTAFHTKLGDPITAAFEIEVLQIREGVTQTI